MADNLSQPFGLRFAPGGDLLVASGNQNRIQHFNGLNGSFIASFASGGNLNLPIGVVYGPDGSLSPLRGEGVMRAVDR